MILSYLCVEVEIKCSLNVVVKGVKEVAQRAAKHITKEKPRIRFPATTKNGGKNEQKPGDYFLENSPTKDWEPTHPVEGKMVKFSEYGNIEE
uniref:Candidate secreted effector n=1 Tax=Meloidogyne incognita TaxID=6306 RepID=A0A914L6P6_MELIC